MEATGYLMILAALALGTGWLVGCHEGMVHVKPIDEMHRYSYPTEYSDWFVWESLVRQFNLGVRGHVWANRYHAITTGMRAGILVLGAYLLGGFAYECIDTVISYHVPPTWFMFQITAEDLLPQYLWYLALVLSLGWLSYEPSYEYARYGTVMDRRYKEHVNFFDAKIRMPWYRKKYAPHGWYMRQLLPFHAPSWAMHLLRLALVCTLVGVAL